MNFASSGYTLAMASGSLQPLHQPWTEHVAPTGHLYYYNPHTTESTYNRPISLTFSHLASPSKSPPKTKRKKEKPAKKTRVLDSVWVRVLTNRGNVFYFDSEKGESTWECPKEIEAVVETMEAAELEDAKEAMGAISVTVAKDGAHGSPLGTKRKIRDEDGTEKRTGKRLKRDRGVEDGDDKGRDTGAEDTVNEDKDEEAWQRRIAEEIAEGETENDEAMVSGGGENKNAEEITEEKPVVPSMPLEEATQLFKAVLRDKQINPMHPWERSLPLLTTDPQYAQLETSLQIPAQRDLFEDYCREILKERKTAKRAASGGTEGSGSGSQSAQEGYRKLLKEAVTSTRTTYTEFRQKVKKERRFYSYGRDEKEREREFRAHLKELGEIKKKERKKAEDAFILMLQESRLAQATSSPGASKKWSDVKKAFHKDPRYDAVGSSALREELYGTFVKSVQETRMGGVEEVSTLGKPVNRTEEGELDEGTSLAKRDGEVEKKRRREKAVREREERVRVEKERTARENARSRAGLNLEGAELAFNTLLVDAIRDPTVSFTSAMSHLSADPRFTSISQASAMAQSRLNNLFQGHISHLQSKGSSVLYALFKSHAPGLDAQWKTLSPEARNSIANNAAVKRLGLDAKVSLSLRSASRSKSERGGLEYRDGHSDTDEEADEGEKFEYPALRHEFEKWQRQRYTEARGAFDAMLAENAFVEFWGRVGKMGLTDQEEKQRLGKVVFADENAAGVAGVGDMEMDEDVGEGEGGGGKRDLQALAKGIDVKEVERVLRRDKRYIVFDYTPEERENWITEYLRGLSAPTASVHVG